MISKTVAKSVRVALLAAAADLGPKLQALEASVPEGAERIRAADLRWRLFHLVAHADELFGEAGALMEESGLADPTPGVPDEG